MLAAQPATQRASNMSTSAVLVSQNWPARPVCLLARLLSWPVGALNPKQICQFSTPRRRPTRANVSFAGTGREPCGAATGELRCFCERPPAPAALFSAFAFTSIRRRPAELLKIRKKNDSGLAVAPDLLPR